MLNFINRRNDEYSTSFLSCLSSYRFWFYLTLDPVYSSFPYKQLEIRSVFVSFTSKFLIFCLVFPVFFILTCWSSLFSSCSFHKLTGFYCHNTWWCFLCTFIRPARWNFVALVLPATSLTCFHLLVSCVFLGARQFDSILWFFIIRSSQ